MNQSAMTPTDRLIVNCQKCGYERTIGYLPMPMDAAAALLRMPCAGCGSKKGLRMGPKPKATEEGRAEDWINNGDTGVSSETIWSVLLNRHVPRSYFHADVPHDPDDFGRCYRLLQVMPAWRARLGEVAAKYPAWRPLVDAWDELTALYEEELPSGKCSKLYARMQALVK